MTPIETQRVKETKLLIGEGDAPSNELVCLYLQMASRRILKRLYPCDPSVGVLPDEYVLDAEELASRMYARRGAEGEVSHSENGIARTYGSADDEDILGRITPFVKVVK